MPYLELCLVPGIRFEFPDLKGAFISRKRKHRQPSQDVLRKIETLDTYVVAVGNKASSMCGFEWRICDTAAEIVMMRSLNETQLQLYILLKLLIKCVLRDMTDISSYFLKNIVLWMAELLPGEMFRRHLLVQLVLHALKLLRQCVKQRHLPNYMMPERNMFSGKLKRQKKVLQLLTTMLDQGEAVVMMCPRLKEAMMIQYATPERARCLSEMRDKLEIWFLSVITKGALSAPDMDLDTMLV